MRSPSFADYSVPFKAISPLPVNSAISPGGHTAGIPAAREGSQRSARSLIRDQAVYDDGLLAGGGNEDP